MTLSPAAGPLLNFVLAESALELAPKEIRGHPAVANDSKRRGVGVNELLLDRSFHHAAMVRLRNSEKRGRPDLVHAALLSVTGTPIYQDGLVRAFIHTYDDQILELAPKTRIPKNYLRFRGLMEEALVERPQSGLIQVSPGRIRELAKKVGPDTVIGLTVQGEMTGMGVLARMIAGAKEPMVLVGGFPHGHFSPETLSAVDRLVRVHQKPLEAHIVTSRVLYEVEKLTMG